MKIGAHLREIEQLRSSRVLLLAASHLQLDLLAPLYETLREMGRVDRLDVLIHCRGGEVTVAHRVALLLHEFTDHLAFLTPHHCQSSGTIMALAAHEIVAGPVALFSPVDPLLHAAAGTADETSHAVSSQDVRLFGEMARHWFGLEDGEAKHRAMEVMCGSIFPPTLTAFYRATRETAAICEQLLALSLPDAPPELRTGIVERLLFGFHSHSYAVTPRELADLGLRVVADPRIEGAAWAVARIVAARTTDVGRSHADRFGATIATASGGWARPRGSETGAWEAVVVE